jgi:hypothetical protein
MGLFNLAGSISDTFKQQFAEKSIKDKLAKVGENGITDPIERAKMARNLETLKKSNEGGFMSSLGRNMMANAKQNLGFGGSESMGQPMIGQMMGRGTEVIGPDGQPMMLASKDVALQAGAGPAQIAAMNAANANYGFGNMPVGQQPGLLMANPVEAHKKTGALNVPADYESSLKKLFGFFG